MPINSVPAVDQKNPATPRPENGQAECKPCVPASRFFRTNEMPSACRIRYFETTNSGCVRVSIAPALQPGRTRFAATSRGGTHLSPQSETGQELVTVLVTIGGSEVFPDTAA